jgi:putative membrane protein
VAVLVAAALLGRVWHHTMDFRSPAQQAHSSSIAALPAAAVLVAGSVILLLVELGPLSTHMAAHIASMSVAAPLVAMIWRRPASISCSPLWAATACQSALLWMAHSPALHGAIQADLLLLAGMQAVLFVAALVFWQAILAAASPWHAMFALLLSGKLACLLGVLLVFAPRPLFATHASHATHDLPASVLLADQHLAGLLMIVACPLSYVLAAVVLAARTLERLDKLNARTLAGVSITERG